MAYDEEYELQAARREALPKLEVPAPFGVLPYNAARNPMSRSNSAHRVSMAMAFRATAMVPQIFHFESGGEFAVALEASLDPELYGLEVQLPPIRYPWPWNKKGYRDHYFDLRLTFDDGFRTAVYVKNGKALKREWIKAEIDAIFSCVTEDFADEAIVVNTDDYSRPYRDNLRRMWKHCQSPCEANDDILEEAAHTKNYWLLKDLVAQCPLTGAEAWQSALRLIARGRLAADMNAVFCHQSRVWLP
ncbi:MAG: hypothetical protein ABJ143_00010 [Parasphingorhabdus sp.]|uniref:hypothetical protein n=1 Tax=Parasphingorhabdus sp. TaxID=2709688 RepID=UPI00327ADD02